MGKTLSGIIIEGAIETIDEIEHLLNCKIQPTDDTTLKNCSIYFLENSVFIELENDIISEPIGVKKGNCISFVLSGSTDAYSINYCEKTNFLKGFKTLGGERFEEYGTFPSGEDDYSIILNTVNKTIGQDIHTCIDERTPQHCALEFNGLKVNYPSYDNNTTSKKVELRSDFKEFKITAPDDSNVSNEIFQQLLSEDASRVLKTLSEITESQINTHTIAYILVLTRFHVEAKVRKEAKKLLKKFASESLWNQVESAWDDKHRNIQGYHEKREYYEHSDIDAVEYFLFAYANRRHFFSIKPVKGMYNVYSSMTPNKEEIQHVFECYGKTVESIPEKITTLDHIKVAKFNSTIHLNLPKAIELLSQLPELHNVVLFATKFQDIPIEVNKLKKLVNLELYGNNIATFPNELYLPNLNYLGISDNDIDKLNFNSFPNLKTLKVSSEYKSGAILFKNVKNPFSVVVGKQTIEVVNPK